MVFSSLTFLQVFLPLTFVLYLFVPPRGKNFLLIVASLLFYAWGEPIYIVLMLLSVVVNYFIGIAMEPAAKRGYAKYLMAAAVVINLSLLGYFKYAGFVVHQVLGQMGLVIPFTPPALPIGISFYTFHVLSYLVDVYRNNKLGAKGYAQRNIFKLTLYISFFPQLIAGPIIKYHDIEAQLSRREITLDGTLLGIRRFIVGLAKKVLIANTLGQVADQVFALDPAGLPTATAWLGIVCYTLQIYFDFSGYSDMAIGLARMFGFTFMENFRYPYAATSVREFWTRWHISLSTWFREYLYIPLGGNRAGPVRTYFNLLIVFFATGLWHGASWNFVIWGLIHGAFMVLERVWLGKVLERNPLKFLNHVYLLTVVTVTWVFFRSETLSASVQFLQALFFLTAGSGALTAPAIFLNHQVVLTLILGALFAAPVPLVYWKLAERYSFLPRRQSVWEVVTLAVLFFLCWVSLAQGSYNPFIYFRF